jgi:membrane protein DedA with SNARE-associated domain
MLLESACIPVPSEATMLFAGFNVANGEYSLAAATTAGVLGNLVGSWIAYWVGYAGRIDILEKHGSKLHIKKSHLEWADRWFERHGDATVFFARMVPIVRTFISLPAGVARMPFLRFSLLTFAGCVPWVLMLTLIGREAGDNWDKWKDNLHYVDYAVIAAVVIAVAYLVVRARRRGKTGGDAAPESA